MDFSGFCAYSHFGEQSVQLYLASMSVDFVSQINLPSTAARARLCVYISADCMSCREAALMMAEIAQRFPQLATAIINLDEPEAERPDNVFAVPTYVLDGKVLFLGNPYREQMFAKLSAALTLSDPPSDPAKL